MSTYPDQGKPAQSLSEPAQRQNIVEEFAYSISDLHDVVRALAERLHPVLSPEYDTVSKIAGQEPMPLVSDHRNHLHSLHAATANLRGLLDRLEV